MNKNLISIGLILVVFLSGCSSSGKIVNKGEEILTIENGVGWLNCHTDGDCNLMVSYCDHTTGLYVYKKSWPKLKKYVGKYFNFTYREIEIESCDIQCIKAPCPDCMIHKEADIIHIEELDLTSCNQDSDCILIDHSVPGMGCALEEGFCKVEGYYQKYGFSKDDFKAINKLKLNEYIKNNCNEELECNHFINCSFEKYKDIIDDEYITKAKCIKNICQKII